MNANALRNWGTSRPPDVILIDLRETLYKYAPSSPKSIKFPRVMDNSRLHGFMHRFPVKSIIEAIFIHRYNQPRDDLVWEFIEHAFPDGTGDFENDLNALDGFSLVVDMITEEVDLLLRDRFAAHGVMNYTDYLFHAWLPSPSSTAIFCHIDFDPKHEFENMRWTP